MRRLQLVFVVFVAVLILGASLAAAGPQARVSGVVVGTDGEPVPGASITLTSAALPKFEKVLTTDDNGEFRVLILDATKTYLFTVTAEGFIEYNQEIKVMVGTTDNDFTFELTTPGERAEAQQQEIMEQPGYKQYGDAKELLEAGKPEEARAKLEEALVEVPDLIEALEALAGLDYDAGDVELALTHARRCLEIDDESLRCLAVAANAAGDLGDTAAREAYLATYQELNPNDPATIFNQAVAFLNKMDDDGARPLLEQCLAADPEFPKCLFQYGMLLLRTGDLEGAKAHLERYIEVAPESDDYAAAVETVKYL
ncbi:MAG: tetratricopeptide repeat protein [Thermoanaerobaculales bacterium]|jgi:tetratricopeptide (TPR) repeat protein|nr:tetratricopeptide repeat protein [Thermoanaerobaculales bacterium]